MCGNVQIVQVLAELVAQAAGVVDAGGVDPSPFVCCELVQPGVADKDIGRPFVLLGEFD